jgi:hypothetical protein
VPGPYNALEEAAVSLIRIIYHKGLFVKPSNDSQQDQREFASISTGGRGTVSDSLSGSGRERGRGGLDSTGGVMDDCPGDCAALALSWIADIVDSNGGRWDLHY